MFGSDSLYSVSPQHWEDLENISLPSLPFLQFPETPLEDEADQSDMTPYGIPVIDPHSVSDSQLEMSVKSTMAQTTITTESLVSEYLSRWEMAEHFSKLHVLVCGCCHSVFHVIDQFRVHTIFCVGVQEPTSYNDTTVKGLALVLWTNTVLRLLREQIGQVGEQDKLTRRIESKWSTLSDKVKIGWEKAAKVLIDISSVHDNILQGQAGKKKDPQEKDENAKADQRKSELNQVRPDGLADKRFVDDDDDVIGKRKNDKKSTYYNCRDKKGRWEATDIQTGKMKSFTCEICDFTAATEWKLRRHMSTRKHLETVENSQIKNTDNATVNKLKVTDNVDEYEDDIEQKQDMAMEENQTALTSPPDYFEKDDSHKKLVPDTRHLKVEPRMMEEDTTKLTGHVHRTTTFRSTTKLDRDTKKQDENAMMEDKEDSKQDMHGSTRQLDVDPRLSGGSTEHS